MNLSAKFVVLFQLANDDRLPAEGYRELTTGTSFEFGSGVKNEERF